MVPAGAWSNEPRRDGPRTPWPECLAGHAPIVQPGRGAKANAATRRCPFSGERPARSRCWRYRAVVGSSMRSGPLVDPERPPQATKSVTSLTIDPFFQTPMPIWWSLGFLMFLQCPPPVDFSAWKNRCEARTAGVAYLDVRQPMFSAQLDGR